MPAFLRASLVAAALATGCGDNAPFAITVVFDGTAALVAAQDGDGSWVRLVPDAEGRARMEVESGRYGYVVLCGDFDPGPRFWGQASAIYDVTPRDIVAGCAAPVFHEPVSLSGSTAPGARVVVDYEEDTADAEGDYVVTPWVGTYDAVAFSEAWILIARDVAVTGDQVLDLPLETEGVALVPITPTIIGTTSPVVVYSDLNTARGTYVYFDEDPTTVMTPPITVLDVADRPAVGARSDGCLAQQPLRDEPLTLVIREASFELDRAAVDWATTDDDWEGAQVRLDEFTSASTQWFSIDLTHDWLETTGASSIPILDLTTLPGWTVGMIGFQPGTTLSWSVGLWRGDAAGDYDACGGNGTLTW